ncbi:MBL fold metallo-hydrolase [Streptomyces sp. NPDC005930]|uniref:MBL fold metallo-hydrolase n=1 Tax=Streptomyces sp. NPDC005930 TaxID=3364736 RepID=UPI00369A0300
METDTAGLALVETGLGDVRDTHGTLGADWVRMAQPALDEEETAVRQIARLGHRPSDVRHIIVTHLDVDYSGDLPDFPARTSMSSRLNSMRPTLRLPIPLPVGSRDSRAQRDHLRLRTRLWRTVVRLLCLQPKGLPHEIGINAVSPGVSAVPASLRPGESENSLGRVAEAEEVAAAGLDLAPPAARVMVGAGLAVDSEASA